MGSRSDGRPAVYDSKVAAAEEAYSQELKNGLPNLGRLNLTETAFPPRPGFGTKGRAITVFANYFVLNPPAKLCAEKYSITINDGKWTGGRRKRNQAITQALERIPDYEQKKHFIATDYATFLVAIRPLGFDTKTMEFRYMEADEDVPRERAEALTVKFEKVIEHDIDDLLHYLNNPATRGDLPNKEDLRNVLNIWLRQLGKANSIDGTMTTVGQKTYDLNAPSMELGEGLLALQGFFSSIKFASTRILVNVNVSTGAFITPADLPYIMRQFGGPRNIGRLEKFLKGVRVELTHIRPKVKRGITYPRIKTIEGFARTRDGSQMTHPPKVQRDYAGAREIMFWREESPGAPPAPTSGKGKKGGKAGAGPAQTG